MSKNLFESLQASHSPLELSVYGQKNDSEDLQTHGTKLNDDVNQSSFPSIVHDQLRYEYLESESRSALSHDRKKSCHSDSSISNGDEGSSRSKTGMIKSRNSLTNSYLVKGDSESSFTLSKDMIGSSRASTASVEKNIWNQLAFKPFSHQNASLEKDKGSFLSMDSSTNHSNIPLHVSPDEEISELDPNCQISNETSGSSMGKADEACCGRLERSDFKVGPLVECTSEINSPDVGNNSAIDELYASSKRICSRRRTQDNYSIESGEILSSEVDSIEDVKKIDTDDEVKSENNEFTEKNSCNNEENEEKAEDTEDTEWCSEDTQHDDTNAESDEDTERASIDSETNDLIIAFPAEDVVEIIDDDDDDEDVDSGKLVINDTGKTEEIASVEKSVFSCPLGDTIVKGEPNEDSLNTGKVSVKEEIKDVDCVISKDLSRPSIRQVSFFEKAADFFCINLLDDDVHLSPPSKSVLRKFPNKDSPLPDTNVEKQELKIKEESDQIVEDVENESTNDENYSLNKDICGSPSLFESCSLNEILMKEEEEDDYFDENEFDKETNSPSKSTDEGETSQENISLLTKLKSKENDSRLSAISKRLRNRMPHWDDSFNEAFVPQIRKKPAVVSASNSSQASSHTSSDSSKRSKASHQSNENHLKSTLMPEYYRDPITFVPQHVKKVRQLLTSQDNQVNEEKVVDTDTPNDQTPVETDSVNIRMGCPNPKAALRVRKHSYHDSKKALRLPQKLIRNLPSPTIKNSEETDSSSVISGQLPPTATSIEFRSSLGASVRTKPRAFTKAALRRQIIEEASTAKPQFRVKTRPAADDGSGGLALVITRVTPRPSSTRRSLSASFAESDAILESESIDNTGTTADTIVDVVVPTEVSTLINDSIPNSTNKKSNCPDGKESSSIESESKSSPEKRKITTESPKPSSIKNRCSTESSNELSKRRRRDSDSSAASSTRDVNPQTGNSSSHSSTRSSSRSPSKNTQSTYNKSSSSDTNQSKAQTFDEDATCRNAVIENFRGVASNRKRFKNQKKHRLLQEIENTSGFLMDKRNAYNREQRAIERILLQNAQLNGGNNSEKQADSSVHSSPRVVLERLSPEQVKSKRVNPPKQKKKCNRRDALHDYKNQKPDNDQRKLKNNVAVANRITAKYAAAKMERVRSGTGGEMASIHPRVRSLIRRVNGRDIYGRTALHLAAALGQLESLLYCLKLKMDVNERDHSGSYPIHSAARNGDTAIIKVLVEAGANVNEYAGMDGSTPLHEAAGSGKIEAVMELLSRGADRTITTYDGTTPADCAKQEEIKNLLDGNQPISTDATAVKKATVQMEDIKFELYDKCPPLVFTLPLESTKTYSEVLLLSELCDFCKLDKVDIPRKKPFIRIENVPVNVIHKRMRPTALWPAVRLRLRIDGSMQSRKTVSTTPYKPISLVIYTEEIRSFICGFSMNLTHEDVMNVKDPPRPPVSSSKRKRKLTAPKAKKQASSAIRDGIPKQRLHEDSIQEKYRQKPQPSIVIGSKRPHSLPNRPRQSIQNVNVNPTNIDEKNTNIPPKPAALMNDEDGSSDEDVIITGIFSAPKRPTAEPLSPHVALNNITAQQRKRPVASVIPNRVQSTKQMRLSQDSDSDSETRLLKEEYMRACERIKMERRNLEQKELQLREKIMAMGNHSRPKVRRISDGKVGELPKSIPGASSSEINQPTPQPEPPSSSLPTEASRLSPTLLTRSMIDSISNFNEVPKIDFMGPTSSSSDLSETQPRNIVVPSSVSSIVNTMNSNSKPETSICASKPISPGDQIVINRRGLCGMRLPLNRTIHEVRSQSPKNFSIRASPTPTTIVTRLPLPPPIRTKVVPTSSSIAAGISLQSPTNAIINRTSTYTRQMSDAVSIANSLPVQRLIPVTAPNNSLMRGQQLIPRLLSKSNNKLGPTIYSAPIIDIPENKVNELSSVNEVPSPSGSPPLLVPQAFTTNQNITSRVSPIPNSAPPLLFPQEPPVLLPCPKIADSTYPVNKSRSDNCHVIENDEAPPKLIPSSIPPARLVKCASELLQKPKPVRVSHLAIPFPSGKGQNSTSPDKCMMSSSLNDGNSGEQIGPPELNFLPRDVEEKNSESSRRCLNTSLSSNEGHVIPNSSLSKPGSSFQQNIPFKSFNSDISHRNEQNSDLTASDNTVVKLCERRKKRPPLVRFHGDGQSTDIPGKTVKGNPFLIDLTDSISSPPAIGQERP